MDESKTSVAVIGGGTMGGDVALVFGAGGWRTHVVEPSDETRASLPARLQAGLVRMEAPATAIDNFRFHASLDSVPWESVSLVVENVPEVLALKQDVFRHLEGLVRPDTPLTSNSSSFPISRIGEGLQDRTRIAGLHFFMPAHLVPLVEVVRCDTTAPGLLDELSVIMAGLGKVPVKVQRDIPGFLANRIQHALMREALYLVEQGVASVEDVDKSVRFGFGFRYLAAGPLLQKDLGGMDIHYNAATTIYPSLCNADTPSPVLAERVKAGHLGVKSPSRQGFYTWTDEAIAREKARYEALLAAGLKLVRDEIKGG